MMCHNLRHMEMKHTDVMRKMSLISVLKELDLKKEDKGSGGLEFDNLYHNSILT